MSLPSAGYTPAALARFMARSLGPSMVATLGWYDVATPTNDQNEDGEYINLGEYEEPINQTLLLLGIDDLASLTATDGLIKVRAVARWQVWKLARQALSDAYDEREGSLQYTRSQLYEMAAKNEREAFGEAMPYLSTYQIRIAIGPVADPDTATAEFG